MDALVFRYARPAIGHANLHFGRLTDDVDKDVASAAVLDGVVHQIDDRLINAAGIPPRLRPVAATQNDVSAACCAHRVDRILDRFANVDLGRHDVLETLQT